MSIWQNSPPPWRLMDKHTPRPDSSQEWVLHDLGSFSGNGVLRCNGDGFVTKPLAVTCCGEIQLAAAILGNLFGRRDVQLLTDDGRLLNLLFCEKALRSAGDVAHVDVTGELPATPQSWPN
jgi:hypothetical protein